MMGRTDRDQSGFFYEFRLDDMIPKGHLLRRIDVFVTAVLNDLHKLSLSETSSGWRLTENRAMLSGNEGSFQAHWLDGCRSISVAGSARGRDLELAAANQRFAADCS
jgi:hypothetical protein